MITKRDVSKLESLLFLLAVSQNTSKRKVSEELCTSVDTLNKYLSELEQELGIRLLASNGRGCVVTPEAQKIVDLAKNLHQTINILNGMAKCKVQISGTVRLGIIEGINYSLFPENIIDFYEKYPELSLELIICDSTPNLNISEVDVALTYQIPQGNELVNLCTKPVKCGLFASEEYVRRHGMPASLEDMLENHRLVVKFAHKTFVPAWKELIKKAKHISIRTNSSYALLTQIEYGAGIGLIPFNAARAKFVHIDSFPYEPSVNFHLVVHKDTKDSPKIRALINYILDTMKQL